MRYAVFDSLLDSVLVVDRHGNLIYGNATASQLFDISQKRLSSGKPLVDFVQFEDPSCFESEKLMETREPTPYKEMSFTTKGGKQGWGQVTVQIADPDQSIESRTWIIYIRDVTLEQDLQRKYRGELEQKEKVIEDLKVAQGELENYSKNLEKMVAERTQELREANQLLSAILNSLGQGFLVFGADGKVLPFYSRICQTILETTPAGKSISEVLKIAPNDLKDFETWCQTLFTEPIPFEDLVPLGPTLYRHSQNLRIELEFYPMRDNNKKVTGAVLVASNKTDEFKAKQDAEHERAHVKMIMKILKNRRQFYTFLSEARKLLQMIQLALAQSKFQYDVLSRYLHTLKGGAGSFSMLGLHDLTHAAEECLSNWNQSPSEAKLYELRNFGSRLRQEFDRFLSENGALIGNGADSSIRKVEVPATDLLRWAELMPAANIKSEIVEVVREPVASAFTHYSDLISEIALNQGKQLMPLQIEGGEMRIFPEPYQNVFASFIHIFRNAIDHGLETPDERQQSGKDPHGQICVQIKKADNKILLQIKDDGRGISPEIIRNKLKSKGAPEKVLAEDDLHIIQHVFDNDFSTRDQVTDLSGRGVGLNAVKEAVERLGGRVGVRSQIGRGSEFEIELPYLTHSFAPTLPKAA